MQDDDARTACEQLLTTWPTSWIDSAVKAQVMRKNHVGGYTVFNGLTPHDLATFVAPIIQRAILDERDRLRNKMLRAQIRCGTEESGGGMTIGRFDMAMFEDFEA